MLKNRTLGWYALLALLLTAPLSASAVTYNFTSGEVQIRATIEGTGVSVLEPGTSPVEVLLGGSFVDITGGSIVALELIPDADFTIDLDQTVTGFDVMDIQNAILTEDTGATAPISPSGSFALDTMMSATVVGVGGPPPSTYVESLTSGAVGSAFVSGDQLQFAVFGVNIARFESLSNPGEFIEVKADITFFGVVPEPGTALLLGLGLAGLSAARRES